MSDMVSEHSGEALFDEIEKAAAKCESEVHGCGRCCLLTLMQYFNMADKSTIDLFQKAVLALSGGIAQERETCGALLGGIMAIGHMNLSGDITALAVNIEVGHTHAPCLPVAVQVQCWSCRRATVRIYPGGRTEHLR
jgi:hypothetical protein